MRIPIYLLTALFVLLGVAVACSGGGEETPYQECQTDADCGEGYRCELQVCKRVVFNDGDEAEADGPGPVADGDAEPEVDADPDSPVTDGHNAEDDADEGIPPDGDPDPDGGAHGAVGQAHAVWAFPGR